MSADFIHLSKIKARYMRLTLGEGGILERFGEKEGVVTGDGGGGGWGVVEGGGGCYIDSH